MTLAKITRLKLHTLAMHQRRHNFARRTPARALTKQRDLGELETLTTGLAQRVSRGQRVMHDVT